MIKIIFSIVAIIFTIGLTGCSSIRGVTVPDKFDENLPKEVVLKVPLAKEGSDSFSCATHSLAMVMAYHDNLVDTEEKYGRDDVWKASKSSPADAEKYGNDMNGLEIASEYYGFTKTEYVTNMTINEAKYLLSQKLPLVVNIRNFFRKGSHAVVLTGYDEKGFFINDRIRSKPYHKSYREFESSWWANLSSPKGKAYHSAFIVYPK